MSLNVIFTPSLSAYAGESFFMFFNYPTFPILTVLAQIFKC
ncbi:hypothetical protein LM6186_170070 [Listeria monocytogenes]|nr:hypothetical protein LMQOC2_40064 [Listeria monocytogenes QOC2]CUK53023.1 hypothetical protein LM57179_250068 [Listeria monocytogenes]CUK65131.1 hypothetical protein LM601244_100068 [Listeria monocytogenes]CUK70683.1 hypothetical protein LM600727_90066 [Listeria monocytogenes]CUK73554.1 hypothetical protein LM600983_230063 [Listeria monocytogenes]